MKAIGKSQQLFPSSNTADMLLSGCEVCLKKDEAQIFWWTDGPHSCIFWKKKHYLKIISAKIKREQNIKTPKPAELKGKILFKNMYHDDQ